MTAFLLLLAVTVGTAFLPEGAKGRPLPYTVLVERSLRRLARILGGARAPALSARRVRS